MHRFETRVYYEDTDMGGIVYYANYLKFIERARSEAIEAQGIDQWAMKEAGLFFAVRSLKAEFISPARYGDALIVSTYVTELKGASTTLRQSIQSDERKIFEASVTLACIRSSGAPTRFPAETRASLEKLLHHP